jgi:hypothetical protein
MTQDLFRHLRTHTPPSVTGRPENYPQKPLPQGGDDPCDEMLPQKKDDKDK